MYFPTLNSYVRFFLKHKVTHYPTSKHQCTSTVRQLKFQIKTIVLTGLSRLKLPYQLKQNFISFYQLGVWQQKWLWIGFNTQCESRIAFVYANMFESTHYCDDWVVSVLHSRIATASIPEYISGWFGHGFKFHSKLVQYSNSWAYFVISVRFITVLAAFGIK